MGSVLLDMALSVDGFIAGPHGEDVGLHNWYFSPTEQDSHVINTLIETTGAILMGRRTYDLGARQGGFVDNPYRVPHIVLTHAPPEQIATDETQFIFVTGSPASVLAEAQAVAGDRMIVIGGGAATARQFLKAGLVDELQLHLIPMLVGDGLRLFDTATPAPTPLEPVSVITSSGVTHLRYRLK